MSGASVTLADVTSASWSLELDSTAGGGAGSGIGQVVQGLADIDQCIRIILGTLPGEDPFRPTFGCDLTQYIDRPLPAALPAIIGVVTQAIETWEPRVKVLGVTATPAGAAAPGTIDVSVQWQVDLGTTLAPGQSAIGGAGPLTTTVSIFG
ncbi:MAG TPA: GPW/gp25 family protein [Acetobacteraceae bacterium]|nr:GPW/gp25 family protein [Acetobacteraceae bacterium]